MRESIIKCTAVNSSSFCSSSLFKGRAEPVMVLGKSAAGRGTRDFLFPEMCSGVEITLSIHTQQTSKAGGKKSRDDLIWVGGVSEAEALCQLAANQIWMKIAGSLLHQQSPACLSPVFSHMGTIPSRRRAHLPLSGVEGQDHRAAALWKDLLNSVQENF